MSLCSGCLHKWLFPLLDSGFWVQIVVIIHINICRIQYKVWPLIITWSCVIFFNQIQAKFLMWLTAILMTIRFFKKYRKWKVKVTQSCLTLWYHMDYTVHGILQARILEWINISFSRALPNPRFEPRSPTLQVDSLPAEPQGKPKDSEGNINKWEGKIKSCQEAIKDICLKACWQSE